MSHPSLTPAEAERLECLAEEAGEIVQAAMKVLRHGYESVNPTLPAGEQTSNRQDLGVELGNMDYLRSEMLRLGDFKTKDVNQGFKNKSQNWNVYMHHQIPNTLWD